MSTTKNHNYIYGFEDYNIVALEDIYFRNTWTQYLPYGFDSAGGNYIINQDLPYEVEVIPHFSYSWLNTMVFHPDLCINHPELLDTAKKVYTHPSCKLSRSMMAEKYKKSLNPYLSDAVVIPNPNLDNFCLYDVALFVNESAKLIGKVTLNEDNKDVIDKVKASPMGTKFAELLTCNIEMRHQLYQPSHLLVAELFFVGQVLYIPNGQMWAIDILTNKIPVDKIVFESSVQKSLSCDNNKLDLDSLISICDMLNSSDEDNVSAGLKALSMMDWMHYPNSVKYIMTKADKYKWVYNKATNSTSVKFMLKSISPHVRKRNCYPGKYDNDIYEQDYELFKQLKMHYEKITTDDVTTCLRFYNFMTVRQGVLTPSLKF